jgi:ribosomal protein S18 acetylase RimI-like enzyme
VADIDVRRATAFDNELLARLGAETFPGNFVGGREPAAMNDYIATRFTPDVMADLLKESGSTFFIAYAGTEPVGYARLREDEVPAEVTPRPVAEIHRLYVLQDHWGQGHGRALIDVCIEEAAARGCSAVWLGAWSENPRALDFYRSLGFEEVGSKIFQLGDEEHHDLILLRPLTA